MDTQYGIAVNNKFALFVEDEDLDPLEILRQQEEEKEKKKDKKKDPKQKDTKSSKNKKNKTVLVSQDQSNKISDDKENRRDGVKSGRQNESNDNRDDRMRKIQKDNRERDLPPRRRENRDGQEKSGPFGSVSPQSEFRDRPDSGRGRGRGSRGRGGPRGRGGFDRFGKREFDRHSGSDKTGFKSGEKREGSGPHNWGNWTDDIKEEKKGVKATEKREGSGAYNWGSLQDDIVLEPVTTNEDEPAEDVAKDNENTGVDPADKDNEIDENAQKAAEEMTLDEWKAQQTQARAKTDFNLRKAGEGCENTDWKKMFLLKKKPLEEDDSDDEYYESDEEDENRKKKMVNIEITFAESPRRGGRGGRGGRRGERGAGGGIGRGERPERGGMGRGERGGGMGGRGRGRGGFPRGGKHADPAPNVMDDQDFPSLN